MTTKPSEAPWADEPHRLIPTPIKFQENTHAAVWCASEMAYSHNCLMRGLNAILQQGPYVEGDKDAKDFLFFVQSWVKMVDHHHRTEETCMFPEMEKLAGRPGLLEGPSHQHEEFHDGLVSLGKYAETTPADKFSWNDMHAIITSFDQILVGHLREEVDVILSLDSLPSDKLKECWAKAETMAKAEGNVAMLYDIFPCVLGCCDKTYEGGNEFPPLPSWMVYAVQGFFGAFHKGAWRYGPCDFWGRPRPLPMLPVNRA